MTVPSFVKSICFLHVMLYSKDRMFSVLFFFEKECENVAKIPMDTTFCLFLNISEIVCTLLGWLLQENRKRGEVVYFLSFFFFF